MAGIVGGGSGIPGGMGSGVSEKNILKFLIFKNIIFF